MMNKEKTKVLFAVVDSDFADILLRFLTLPLGRIQQLLVNYYGNEAPAIGCLNTMYNGLQNLDSIHFWTKAGKQMLLNPRSALEDECCKMKLNIFDARSTKFFTCKCLECCGVSLYHEGAICRNGETINREVVSHMDGTSAEGVFTKSKVSFLISDDLQILPNAAESIIQSLNNLGIEDTDGAEPKIYTVGFNEIMDLLEVSLRSWTPLTDLFLNGRLKPGSATATPQTSNLLPRIKKEESSNTRMMKIKVMVQKSNRTFLFAQAGEDFVDFLFSLLTIPLGEVECLLNSNASLGSIDNLYRSVGSLDGSRYMNTLGVKDMLIKPKLAFKYLSNKQIFVLTEEASPDLYFHKSKKNTNCCLSPSSYWSRSYNSSRASFVDPKGQGSYVAVFMVTDDLTVTPLCLLTSLSAMKKMKVPASDIEEIEINIGLGEALSILKASLTSPQALSNGLKLNLASKKQVKQEH